LIDTHKEATGQKTHEGVADAQDEMAGNGWLGYS